MRMSESERGQAWLSQFSPDDLVLASRMLDEFLLVPTSLFRQWLGREIAREGAKGRLALYGERELPPNSRFFPTLAPGKVKRAVGVKGPALVKPVRGSSFVGSEGLVGQVLSELARRQDVPAPLTPGPDRLRPIKTRGPTRRLAIVTDLIGSGNRIHRMLEAMWRTETIRSWHAHRKVQLEVIVIAYAATPAGLKRVEGHRLKPTVRHRVVAPTIHALDDDPSPFVNLCERYEPMPTDEEAGATGYGGVGTLIAFGHGCPNTAPPVFWRKGKRWRPLFPQRSAIDFDEVRRPAEIARFGALLLSLEKPSLADPALLGRFNEEAREALLLLATISSGRRADVMLASRTGIDMGRVETLLDAFRHAGWIDAANGMTAQGLAELRSAERVRPVERDVPFDGVSVYYPTSLRG